MCVSSKSKTLEAFALNLNLKTGNFKQREDKQIAHDPGRGLSYRCKVYQYPRLVSGVPCPFVLGLVAISSSNFLSRHNASHYRGFAVFQGLEFCKYLFILP